MTIWPPPTGDGFFPPHRPTRQQDPDTRLARNVVASIRNEPNLGQQEVSVDASSGVVLLAGTVDSPAAKGTAERIVGQLSRDEPTPTVLVRSPSGLATKALIATAAAVMCVVMSVLIVRYGWPLAPMACVVAAAVLRVIFKSRQSQASARSSHGRHHTT